MENIIYKHTDEVFKNIQNSEFWISNYGNLYHESYKRWCPMNNSFSNYKGKMVKPNNDNSKKYWRFAIMYKDKTKRNESIHRLVAYCFLPNPLNKLQINHIDGNKNNNHVSNLEWCTNKENTEHKYTVLKKFAIKNPAKSKLSEVQVKEIAIRINTGETYPSIAKDFNVSRSTIAELKAGRCWRHLNLFPPKKCKSEKYFDLRYDPVVS